MTRFAHADRIVVEAGQEVSRGDVLGYVGDTGTVTAPHLHYEVWIDGVAQDPTEYILVGGVIP
jgi:murein DD-endopeptidase MepM/ murein hydrolase activator NlpD